jgi:KTSC domain-containing protein
MTQAPSMLATAVASSTLNTVAYDHASQVLQLEFRSRAVYRYFGVPPAVYHDLIAADSKGAYFNRNIRPKFPYCKLSGDDRCK